MADAVTPMGVVGLSGFCSKWAFTTSLVNFRGNRTFYLNFYLLLLHSTRKINPTVQYNRHFVDLEIVILYRNSYNS